MRRRPRTLRHGQNPKLEKGNQEAAAKNGPGKETRQARKEEGRLSLSVDIRAACADQRPTLAEQRIVRQRGNQTESIPTMGDKSPKSTQKQASQKQAKSDVSNKKKQQQINDQQATKAKAAAAKKK
jgi:hypothetical protein